MTRGEAKCLRTPVSPIPLGWFRRRSARGPASRPLGRASPESPGSAPCRSRPRARRGCSHRGRCPPALVNPHKELTARQVSLHRVEGLVARGHLRVELICERFWPAGELEPEAHDRECYLQLVLLEEHPLEHLRPLVAILGDEARSLAEVPEDRPGLRQRAAVVENERRHAERRIELAEQLVPIRPVDDVDCPPLVCHAEVREQKPHLVTVPRDRTVVEEHRSRLWQTAVCLGRAPS